MNLSKYRQTLLAQPAVQEVQVLTYSEVVNYSVDLPKELAEIIHTRLQNIEIWLVRYSSEGGLAEAFVGISKDFKTTCL